MKLNSTNTAIIKRLLIGRNSRPLLSILNRVEPADLAALLSNLSQKEGLLLMDALITINKISDVLIEVPQQHLSRLLNEIEPAQLINILVYSRDEDTAYFLSQFEKERQVELIEQLEAPRRSRIQQFLDYPKDSAGRIMQTQVFALPTDITAAQAIDIIRSRAQEVSIYYIYCINEVNQLIGVVSLRVLTTSPANVPISQIMKREIISVSPETPEKEVAHLVAHYDYVAIPVVDPLKHLIGVVTVDDVLDIIQEEATANIYAQAGLQENDRVYTPAIQSIKNRLPWMIFNLALAGLASWVVSLFEATMSHLIILATLKNIVAGSGGNVAIQTITVVTRGLATGDFNFISATKTIIKESIVGFVVGLATGVVCGLVVYLWKGSLLVAVVIFISLLLNSLAAACFGAIIPILMKRLNWDPAVGAGVLVTTVTDVVGFFSFLGIAALGLRLVGAN